MGTLSTLKVFEYIEDLDCFIVNQKYTEISGELGLTEWHPAVWIGRLFSLDNDYGEHWFDNWDLREQLESKAERRGIPYEELMILDPNRFKNDVDGPCHPPEIRKMFWIDVLKSLELSFDLIFAEARLFNLRCQKFHPDDCIPDLEARIKRIRTDYGLD